MVWTSVVGAMVSLVSESPGTCIINGWSGLWGLWCLRFLPLAPSVLGRALVSMVTDGLNLGGRAMVSMVSDGLGYGVSGV